MDLIAILGLALFGFIVFHFGMLTEHIINERKLAKSVKEFCIHCKQVWDER